MAPKVLIVEPFHGGSHRQMVEHLVAHLPACADAVVVTLSPKKWHWRLRTSGVVLAPLIPSPLPPSLEVLFASSMLNLPELMACRPDVAALRKVLYHHEQNIEYPRQTDRGERDFQLAWIQVASSLAADAVLFNSAWNRDSFLNGLPSFLNKMPDHRPKWVVDAIRAKARVLAFPLLLEPAPVQPTEVAAPLHIVWPHRWEFDKGPDAFFAALFALADAGVPFTVSVLGDNTFSELPAVFGEAKARLGDACIRHWGRLESREEYLDVVREADVVVSTALHEFFGVAVMEAILLGCYPVCPDRLAYPEYLPKDYLYRTDAQLVKKLKQLARGVAWVRRQEWRAPLMEILERYSWPVLRPQYDRELTTERHTT